MPLGAYDPAALNDTMMAWRAALQRYAGQKMYEGPAHARSIRDERNTETRMAIEEVAGFVAAHLRK